MTKSPDDPLDERYGGSTIAENLRHAIASGTVTENGDGTFQLASASGESPPNWMHVPNGPRLDCEFLIRFMFGKAYARSAVPHGCRECYKVKVGPRTLRELVAAWQIARRIECRSKWGIDFYNPLSQNIYAGYFYTAGLEGARALFKVAREAFSADAKLGPDIPMTIKRGCSEYEAALGPSDRYEFTPEMAEIEAYLKTRFRESKSPSQLNLAVAFWIDFAFRMGDETYLDFTGGKRLRPKTLTYDL